MERIPNYPVILENLLDIADNQDKSIITSLLSMYAITKTFSLMQIMEINKLMDKYNKKS